MSEVFKYERICNELLEETDMGYLRKLAYKMGVPRPENLTKRGLCKALTPIATDIKNQKPQCEKHVIKNFSGVLFSDIPPYLIYNLPVGNSYQCVDIRDLMQLISRFNNTSEDPYWFETMTPITRPMREDIAERWEYLKFIFAEKVLQQSPSTNPNLERDGTRQFQLSNLSQPWFKEKLFREKNRIQSTSPLNNPKYYQVTDIQQKFREIEILNEKLSEWELIYGKIYQHSRHSNTILWDSLSRETLNLAQRMNYTLTEFKMWCEANPNSREQIYQFRRYMESLDYSFVKFFVRNQILYKHMDFLFFMLPEDNHGDIRDTTLKRLTLLCSMAKEQNYDEAIKYLFRLVEQNENFTQDAKIFYEEFLYHILNPNK